MANHLTSDPKLVIHGNPYVMLFLISFSRAKTHRNRWKLPSINHSCCLRWISRLWYCDVIQTHFVTSFSRSPIVPKNVSKLVTSPCRREVDYHSLIKIETDSRCYRWLACKKYRIMYGLAWITTLCHECRIEFPAPGIRGIQEKVN